MPKCENCDVEMRLCKTDENQIRDEEDDPKDSPPASGNFRVPKGNLKLYECPSCGRKSIE